MKSSRALALRYAAAVVSSALALLLTMALPGEEVQRRLSALFFAAVMLSAFYGGLGPGLLATVLGTLSIAYFLTPPYYTLALRIEDLVRLAVFFVVALVISYLNETRKRAEAQYADLLLREKVARAKAEATEWRYAALSEAAKILTASRHVESVVAHLARLALPRFADACVVDLLSDDGSLRRIAEVHRDPAQAQSVPAAAATRGRGDAEAKELVANVLRNGRAEVTPQAVIVPLVVRGQTLGAMSFRVTDSDRSYGPEDTTFAQDLGRYTALAVALSRATA